MTQNVKIMPREIKFRAWDGEKIVYAFCVARPEACNVLSIMTNEDFAKKTYRLKEWKVMQFTGLKDKNGKEIYEGDILKSIHCKSFGRNDVWYEFYFMVELEEDTYGYGFNWKHIKERKIPTKTKEDYGRFKKEFDKFGQGNTIIGNIYENPELLGGTNE